MGFRNALVHIVLFQSYRGLQIGFELPYCLLCLMVDNLDLVGSQSFKPPSFNRPIVLDLFCLFVTGLSPFVCCKLKSMHKCKLGIVASLLTTRCPLFNVFSGMIHFAF